LLVLRRELSWPSKVSVHHSGFQLSFAKINHTEFHYKISYQARISIIFSFRGTSGGQTRGTRLPSVFQRGSLPGQQSPKSLPVTFSIIFVVHLFHSATLRGISGAGWKRFLLSVRKMLLSGGTRSAGERKIGYAHRCVCTRKYSNNHRFPAVLECVEG
jgi:hypothetical protein